MLVMFGLRGPRVGCVKQSAGAIVRSDIRTLTLPNELLLYRSRKVINFLELVSHYNDLPSISIDVCRFFLSVIVSGVGIQFYQPSYLYQQTIRITHRIYLLMLFDKANLLTNSLSVISAFSDRCPTLF
jgi:hypothetical protein